MHKIFLNFLLSFIYMEMVYHFGAYGLKGMFPWYMILTAILLSAVETALVGITSKRKANLAILWTISGVNYLLFASQVVYYYIFKMPLMIATAVDNGAAALTDFWSVALDGILKSTPYLLLLAVPMILMAILLYKKKMDVDKRISGFGFLKLAAYGVAAISLTVLLMVAGYATDSEDYTAFQEMFDSKYMAQRYGVLPLFERQMLGNVLPEKELSLDALAALGPNTIQPDPGVNEEGISYDTSPNVLNIDFDALMESGDKDIDAIAEIVQLLTPTNKNQYTGMFEGYNLVYITAEAFSPFAVSEELTPTLYKMLNSGIVVKDYYVPLWQTSTSDGEYVNLTGQLPDGQRSFKRTQYNEQPYSLPAYFASEGVTSYAYHNNSLSYYDRYKTHPNLGYIFKAARYGACSKSAYAGWVFSMNGATTWPSSDYEMMVSTIPEWINEDRFHAYYMSLSGHCNYSFSENAMSSKNKDLVADLPYTNEMKAYIACNYELERAVTYLVEQLEAAGKLEKTVIVISADHYPYALQESSMEDYLGYELDDLEIQRNCLIMWNSEMETITVDKTCSALDIFPTILNLFGFDYDSRLFPGNDMLSTAGSLVIFRDQSFITDTVIYNATDKTVTSRTGEEISDEYIQNMKDYVKILFKYSKGVVNDDFFKYVNDAVIEEKVVEDTTTEETTDNTETE